MSLLGSGRAVDLVVRNRHAGEGAGRHAGLEAVAGGWRNESGGDAETSAGMDVGAGLTVSVASRGLSVYFPVWTLLERKARGFRRRRAGQRWEVLYGRETMAAIGARWRRAGRPAGTERWAKGCEQGSRFVAAPRGGSARRSTAGYQFGHGLGVPEQGAA